MAEKYNEYLRRCLQKYYPTEWRKIYKELEKLGLIETAEELVRQQNRERFKMFRRDHCWSYLVLIKEGGPK